MALGLAVMFAMAYAEGANDVSKVVATLIGSGITSYRRAILFGTVCTSVGALAAAVLAEEVMVTLTKGLVVSTAPVNETFGLAALLGAMCWVLVATRIAMPVSSSHAIVGSILILGVFVFGPSQIRWDAVWQRVFLPMAGSPLIAVPLAFVLYHALAPLARYISLARLHWFSAGAASFARGVNDAPKIAALGAFFYLTGEMSWSRSELVLLFAVVATGMALGSLVAGKRVTETLAKGITPMDNVEGLAANATTAFLVISASRLGLPVSITHVISTSIIGIGALRHVRFVSWSTVNRMALAWFITLPTSGILATVSYLFIGFWR